MGKALPHASTLPLLPSGPGGVHASTSAGPHAPSGDGLTLSRSWRVRRAFVAPARASAPLDHRAGAPLGFRLVDGKGYRPRRLPLGAIPKVCARDPHEARGRQSHLLQSPRAACAQASAPRGGARGTSCSAPVCAPMWDELRNRNAPCGRRCDGARGARCGSDASLRAGKLPSEWPRIFSLFPATSPTRALHSSKTASSPSFTSNAAAPSRAAGPSATST